MSNEYSQIPHYLQTEDFYSKVKARLRLLETTGDSLYLATLDFDHFNYINDLFGYETGDLTLQQVAKHFSSQLSENEIFSRIHADLFVFCLNIKNHEETINYFHQMTDLKEALKNILPPHYNMVASGGIVSVHDNSHPLSALLDKANYARKRAKGNTSSSFRFYDDKMSEEIQWQKIVTISMETALKNREFEMYLQPKILFKNDDIAGAEALVRWNSPEYGLIYPDRFIPIMEQSGFIRQLDFFMLEEACRFLKESSALGISRLPISVNFSKAHITTENLVERIFQTVNQIGIPTGLIEIEFTESLSAEGFEKLIEIVMDLKLLGFRVSLDDFGNAYSSLSCLKDLPIDIIKIDKGFLNSSTNTDKGKLILTKVVELIKSLRMCSVMEGVEDIEQADFLRKLSCDYGQGYFYAKPMPVSDYVKYINSGSVSAELEALLSEQTAGQKKSQSYAIPDEFQMDNWELYTLGKNIDMGLMKGYLNDEATIQYINDRALEYFGYSRQEFREMFHNSIVAFTHPDDIHLIQENTAQLITTGKPMQFQIRAIRKDGKIIFLRGNVSCVIDNQGHPVGLYAFQDVTGELENTAALQQSLTDKIAELEKTVETQKAAEEKLRLSEERYRMIVEQNNDVMFDWDFTTDTIQFSEKCEALFGRFPDSFNRATVSVIRDWIHPDDLSAFEQWVTDTYRQKGSSSGQYRSMDSRGNYCWIRCRSTAIYDGSGNPIRALGVFSNIDEQKQELDTLTIKSQCDSLTKLFNKIETQTRIQEVIASSPENTGAFFIIDIDNFKGLNDNLGHQLGDTVLIEIARRLQELFKENSIIGRIGGDEFAVYVWGLDEKETADKAELLGRTMRMAYYGSASKYSISGSIGISHYPAHGRCFDELYHCSDIALYESKHSGKDRCTIYHDHMTGKLKDNRTPVEWTEGFLNTYFQGDFPFEIFEMLYETKDMKTSIQLILELMGKKFHVDRSYIFQNDASGRYTSNTYEWCAPGVSPEQKNLQKLPLHILDVYFKDYSPEGVFCCSDIRLTDEKVYEVCHPQGIKSLLHCAIYNEGSMTGFIGFDICSDYHEWTGEEIALLGYISRILSVFLNKTDTAKELETSYMNYMEMIKNLSGFVYVVDPQSYEILFINTAVNALGLSIGQPCYRMAFDTDTPCDICPIRQLSDTVHYASKEIFSKKLNGWINATASKLKWEGEKDAVLIHCTDISKYIK